MRQTIVRLALLGVFLSTPTLAEDEMFGVPVPDVHQRVNDDDPKAQGEEPLVLPKPPVDADLIPFDVSESFSFNYAIDKNSLTFGKDGIMRYTVVIVSKMGAKSVFYEGLKCWGTSAKRYAELASDSDGKWRLARNRDWKHVGSDGRNNYRFALLNDYWCHAGTPMFSVEDMIKALKRGGFAPTESPYEGRL